MLTGAEELWLSLVAQLVSSVSAWWIFREQVHQPESRKESEREDEKSTVVLFTLFFFSLPSLLGIGSLDSNHNVNEDAFPSA